MSPLQRWLASLGGTALATSAAYAWLDRPVARFAHTEFAHHQAFAQLTHIPDPLGPMAVIVFIALGLSVLGERPLPKLGAVALMCSISLVMAAATKNLLKFVFGRTWPETWVHNNPSFIHDGIYGFHFFHGGPGYESFPSGHTAATCAVISVLWIHYPRLRALYVLAVAAVVVGLIGADYHFLADTIAGGFVGVSTGWMTSVMWGMHQAKLANTNK